MNDPTTQPRSIMRNAASLFGAHFIGKALSFGLIVILPWYVESATLGVYFVAAATVGIFGAFAEFGIHDPLLRRLHLEPDRARQTLGVAVGMRLLLSLSVMVASAVYIWVNRYDPERAEYVWWLGGSVALNGFASALYTVFRARERMGYESAVVLVERLIVVLIGGGLFVFGIGTMRLFCIVIFIASVAHVGLTVAFVAVKFTPIIPRFRWNEWRDFARLTFPFWFANGLILLYYRIDTILLERWSDRGAEAVAWYGIAYSWVMALTILPGAIMSAAYPRISRLVSGQTESDEEAQSLSALYTGLWRIMAATGVPLAMITAAIAPKLIALLYPDARYPTGTADAALASLAWVLPWMFFTAILVNTLRAANHRRALLALIALTTAINILLNAFLMPRYAHVGAAWALVGSEAFLVVAGTVYIRLKLSRWSRPVFWLQVSVSWVGLGVALWLTRAWSLFLQVPVAVAVVFALLYAARGLRKDDFRLGA
ncbi:MAG: flippase [Candidatus Poribacteria bacterium]|nr:flippase [Candidatus Poribacteria bacterium]